MTFDYKKEYKEYYLPPQKPTIVDVPKMNFIAVYGKGNPNDKDGDYQHAIESLYTIAYTIKMSKKTNYHINGYFDYVVPPLEGFGGKTKKKIIILTKKIFNGFLSFAYLTSSLKKMLIGQKKKQCIKRKKTFLMFNF